MASMNRVTIIGYVGRDPELKQTPSGVSVCNFSVATTDYKDKETTEWHKVVSFNKLAEICGQYLRRGSQVCVEGRLQTRKWQGKDGNDRYSTEIVCNNMLMLGKAGEAHAVVQDETAGTTATTTTAPDTGDDSDMPF